MIKMTDAVPKPLNLWLRKDLLALPVREWHEVSEYDSLLLLSTGRKHDSGGAMMAIIGVRDLKPVEIACNYCNDIGWKFPRWSIVCDGRYSIGQMGMDCALKSGALHAWTDRGKFRVGTALSSVTVELLFQ